MTATKPTEDEATGMAWWNGMTEQQRGEALDAANAKLGIRDSSPADAWSVYKTADSMAKALAAGQASTL